LFLNHRENEGKKKMKKVRKNGFCNLAGGGQFGNSTAAEVVAHCRQELARWKMTVSKWVYFPAMGSETGVRSLAV